MQEFETVHRQEEWSHDMLVLFLNGQKDRKERHDPKSENEYYLRGYNAQSDLEEVKAELWI